MREIIFRGKRKANPCEWVEGYLFEYDAPKSSYILGELDFRESIYDIWKCAEEVITKTVGQFTDKYDKNGKKIFEDDIVRAMMDFGPGGFHERVVCIGWDDDLGYQWDYFDMSTVEVIGNIHDNPELLKGD